MAARVKTLKLTEKAFQAQVVQYARLHGWLVFHDFDSRRSEPGLPDLLMVRGSRLVFAELKVGKNKLSEAQEKWVAALEYVTDNVYVWRPEDWPSIELVLGGGKGAA